jgi:hypothetical protein
MISLDSVIARHLQLGFSVVVRDDDYQGVYGTGLHPKRVPKDTKYGVCFRACLPFVPSLIASELKLANQAALAASMTINFVLEQGHRNVGDARRLFDLYKADVLPDWEPLLEHSPRQRKIVPVPKLPTSSPMQFTGPKSLSMAKPHQSSNNLRTSQTPRWSPIITNGSPYRKKARRFSAFQ